MDRVSLRPRGTATLACPEPAERGCALRFSLCRGTIYRALSLVVVAAAFRGGPLFSYVEAGLQTGDSVLLLCRRRTLVRPFRCSCTGDFTSPLSTFQFLVSAFQPGLLHAAFHLTLVVGAIELALRLRNESILSHPPLFEAAEPNPMPSSPRPVVSADKRPVVHRAVAFNTDVVHLQLHVRKRGHESLRHVVDGAAPGSQSAIDAERAVRREKRGHARGLPAAPRCRIALRKISQLSNFKHHPHLP